MISKQMSRDVLSTSNRYRYYKSTNEISYVCVKIVYALADLLQFIHYIYDSVDFGIIRAGILTLWIQIEM